LHWKFKRNSIMTDLKNPARLSIDSSAFDGEPPAFLSARPVPARTGKARRGAAESAATGREPFDADLVVYRLEEAGTTLLALPGTGWSPKLRMSSLEIVRNAIEAYGWAEKKVRPAVPDPAKIDRMDEALAWIPLIPQDKHVLRRIVGARCLVSPTTERHLYSWRRLGTALGADHKAVQRWHAQGIDMIVAALNRKAACQGLALS
jgi:hypothetical protein